MSASVQKRNPRWYLIGALRCRHIRVNGHKALSSSILRFRNFNKAVQPTHFKGKIASRQIAVYPSPNW